MKIIDAQKNTVPFSSLSIGDVCRIPWDDCSKPTYAMRIMQYTDSGNNAVDLEEGDVFEVAPSQQVVPIKVELTVL